MEVESDADPQFSTMRGGYDYDFTSPLDKRYECHICLLAVRNPHQTVCGHRFCKECILSCIRLRHACPIDNRPLSEDDVFPDVCIEREVLDLEVKCPGHIHGCQRTTRLQNIGTHIKACNYQVVLCPNECTGLVLAGELQQHVEANCPHRTAKCRLCLLSYTIDSELAHRRICGEAEETCEECGVSLKRLEMSRHMTSECPDALVVCQFAEFGCSGRFARKLMDEHLRNQMHSHLQMVASAHKKTTSYVGELTRTVGLLQSPVFSRKASLRSQPSVTSQLPEEEEETVVGGASGTDRGKLDRNSGNKFEKFKEIDHEQREAIASEARKHQQMLHTIWSNPESKLYNNEEMLQYVNRKLVDIDQRLMEETIRIENLYKLLDKHEVYENEKIAQLAGRFCNGDYLWRLDRFSQRCAEMKNTSHSVYSPPFYSSLFGYKCCIKINVSLRDNHHFLSLFLAFMQGDYDDVLDWPFQGRVVLSILDQSSQSNKQHIVENIDSSYELQAFQRPMTTRHEKSFGVTKFQLLDTILAKSSSPVYVLRDVLYIKAKIVPRGNVCETCVCNSGTFQHDIRTTESVK